LIGLGALVSYPAFEALRIARLARRSRALLPVAQGRHGVAPDRVAPDRVAPDRVAPDRVGDGPRFELWAMGDSLAAGYGASSFEASFVGRVAQGLSDGHEVLVTDVARSGATMAEVLEQPLPTARVDLVLVAAGSNDLVRLAGAAALLRATAGVVTRLTAVADRVVVVGPGVVADAGLIPWVARPLYRLLRPSYVAAMTSAVADYPTAIYVDPAAGTATSSSAYGNTVSAADHFHLSDEGHRWWADRILAALAAETLARPAQK
jgi:lysophospholipase L1-like esterase